MTHVPTGVDSVADLPPSELIRHVAHLAALVRDGATAETAGELVRAASLLRALERDPIRPPATLPEVTWLTWADTDAPSWTAADTVRVQTAAAGGYLIATGGQMRAVYGGQRYPVRRRLAMQSLASLPRTRMPDGDRAPVMLYATNGGGATSTLLSAVGRQDVPEYPGGAEPTTAAAIETLIGRVVHRRAYPWEW